MIKDYQVLLPSATLRNADMGHLPGTFEFSVFTILMLIAYLKVRRDNVSPVWSENDKDFKRFCETAESLFLRVDTERRYEGEDGTVIQKLFGTGISVAYTIKNGEEKIDQVIDVKFEGTLERWIIELSNNEPVLISTPSKTYHEPELSVSQKFLLERVVRNIENSY